MSRIDRIELETAGPDGMSGTTWTFFLLGEQLVVDSYATWAKESKRHKARITGRWERLNRREATIKQSDVPLTPAIADWAKREWLKALEASVSVGFQESR